MKTYSAKTMEAWIKAFALAQGAVYSIKTQTRLK